MAASSCDETALAVTAEFIARDIMGIKTGEQVLITADMATDMRGVQAMFNAARVRGGKVALLTFPQLPYQGGLADPYIPETVSAASQSCDVWFDFTFPYIAGSGVHAAMIKAKRARFLAFSDLGGDGIVRLFGQVDYDRLFALQDALDALIAEATGRECRVTSPSGTELRFKLARPATRKLRHLDRPGSSTVPGSAVLYPEPASVQGVVVIEAAFHEYHTRLHAPIRVEVDGRIRAISGGGVDLRVMERSLKRAGGGEYGSIIHFSHAFHPAARLTGKSFVEDIRVPGCDAIGFGIPWWEPGGGENHPDGMITMQSLWIDNRQIVEDGRIIGPPELVRLEQDLNATLR